MATVLLVEDDTDVRGVFREFLAAAGYRVRAAADGQEALALLAEEVPAAILTDLNMPNLDGWELLRVLRADPVMRQIPVAIMTAEDDFPAGYLVFRKPFRMEAVLQFLEASCATVLRDDGTGDPSPANPRDEED